MSCYSPNGALVVGFVILILNAKSCATHYPIRGQLVGAHAANFDPGDILFSMNSRNDHLIDTARRKPVGLALWGNEPISDTVRHARNAEMAGFDGIWLVDSQLICREMYVTLAACAANTST
jgi:hypothetical protein